MSKRWVEIVVGSDKVTVVDVKAPMKGPLEIQADLTWPLQSGSRGNAYVTMHKTVSQYMQEKKVDQAFIKESAVSLGGTKKAHLESAELRGVVIAAASLSTVVETIAKSKISRTFGERKADEYIADDNFWKDSVEGKLRGGSREAALLMLAARGKK